MMWGISLPNSIQPLYMGLLLAGTLAVPVAAETRNSEIVPESEMVSAVSAIQPINESDPESAALVKDQEAQGHEIQLSLEKSPQTLSVTAQESLVDLKPNFEQPVEDAIASAAALQIAPVGSTQTATEEIVTPVRELAQANPVVSPSEQEFLGVDDLQETQAEPMDQVTNVTELRDVQPSDWAYEALRSLVERYGCIAGYPDSSFRGNRAMSRYEFAAGLSACLQQIERLLPNSGNFVSQEDLKTLQRLIEEYSGELATLKTRVDTLEGRTAFLEEHQFSTTTKLFGQAIIGVQGRSENQGVGFLGSRIRDRGTNINVITNTQLSLFTQLSPRSILLMGLQAGAGSTFPFNPNPTFTRLGYEGPTSPDNNIVLSDLTYRQLLGNKFAFIVGTAGVNPVNVFRGANRVESAGFGPISLFAQRNPIINIGGSSGVGFDWQITPRISLQGVYSTDFAENPSFGGIFGGNRGRTAAGVQLAVTPINRMDIALNYINSYAPGGRSDSGSLGTGVGDDLLTGIIAPLKTDAFGGTISLRVTRGLTIGGWAGYTNSRIPGESGNVETFNWMGFLNFPDLLGRGNLAGIYVGQPPKITSSDLPGASGNLPFGFNIPDLFVTGNGNPGGRTGTATHVEAFYRLRVTDNITITPGVVVVFDPGHNPNSDTVTIGAVRTTFTF